MRRMNYRENSFSMALAEINRDVSKVVQMGKKKYFRLDDLKAVYQAYAGSCSWCGKVLKPFGRGRASVHFMLYVPLRNGGKVERDNLVTSCSLCKDEYLPVKGTRGRVEGYNSLADIIVALVSAVKQNKPERDIQTLKSELNTCIAEFAHSLNYRAGAGAKAKPIVEGTNTIADLVEDLAEDKPVEEEVKGTISTIAVTRRYRIIKDPNGD